MPEHSRRLTIETPSGARFEADVPCEMRIGDLAADFFRRQGGALHDEPGRGGRAVAELVDPGNPNNTKRLDGEWAVGDLPLRDGDTLRIFLEPTAGGSPAFADERALSLYVRREKRRLLRAPDAPHLRAELDSLDRIKAEFGDLLHDLRPLADFRAWLRLPGRQRLFDCVCRFVPPEEWYASVADLGSVPWIFGGPGGQRRHLRHCPYCRTRLRLAEGRYWQELAGAPQLLAGDRLAADLVEAVCRDASRAAAAIPVPGIEVQAASPFELPPPLLRVTGPAEPQAGGERLRVPARLEGDPRHQQVELAVAAEFVDRGREPGPAELAFPNPLHPDSLVSLAGGATPLELLVSRPRTPGRYFFRYGTCPHGGSGPRQLQGLSAPHPTPGVVGFRTRGSGSTGLVAAARTPDSEPVLVEAGVVTLDWGG
jgi:hypothetical protein